MAKALTVLCRMWAPTWSREILGYRLEDRESRRKPENREGSQRIEGGARESRRKPENYE